MDEPEDHALPYEKVLSATYTMKKEDRLSSNPLAASVLFDPRRNILFIASFYFGTDSKFNPGDSLHIKGIHLLPLNYPTKYKNCTEIVEVISLLPPGVKVGKLFAYCSMI